MMTDTAGTRTRDRPRRRALGRRGGRHPQGHPPRRGRQRGDRRRAGRHAGPGDPGGPRPAPRLRPLPRAHPDDRHRGHRLLRGGPGPRPGGPPARRPARSSVPSAPSAAAASPTRSTPTPPPAEHRPGADALPVAKTGTGPCEQIRVLLAWRRSAMKARVAAHRQITALPATAPDAVRTRPAPPQRRGGSSTPWPARAPPRPPTAPASATARALRRPGPPPPDPGPTRSPTSTPSCAHQPPAPPRRCSPPRATASSPPPPCSPAPTDNPGRIRTEASFAALCGAAPIPAGPREDQPPPTQPRRRPTGQPGAAPQRPARPATRAPRPTPPASPPRARAAKRYCAAPERAIAREAWHLPARPQPAPRTDDLRRGRHERGLTPRPSRPPPEHPPGPDQRTRTRHTPRHHPHRSIPPMAQHPTTTDPHHLTPIGASTDVPGPTGRGGRRSDGEPGARLDDHAGPAGASPGPRPATETADG